MILAAADYGLQKAGTTPPGALLDGWDCEHWGTEAIFGPGPLPRWLIRRMNVCLSVYQAHKSDRQRNLALDVWAERYPHYWSIISYVQWLRVKHGSKP